MNKKLNLLKDRLAFTCAAHFEDFVELSHFVYRHPELGGEEHKSSQYLATYLKAMGFEVSFPYEGLPTAFNAEYGPEDAEVTIAFLAEYDALPGFGPEDENGERGLGHACGHNWIAAAMCGCGVTLAAAADTAKCKVRVIGTPAEETFSAKVDMARLGAFDGVDFVFQAHLSKNFSMGAVTLAMYSVEFDFHGKSAHASINPQAGINALDGVLSMFFNMNAMRQYLREDARVHGIITNGGKASNVIPDFAQCQFEIRAKTRGYLDEIRRRLIAVAESAAAATGTTVEYRDYENYNDEVINLKSFASVCEKHFDQLGIGGFVPEEEYEGMGSSDLGNVSYLCPTVYAEVMLDGGVPVLVHDQSAMEQVDSPSAHEMMRKVILAFSGAACEIALNPDLAGQIRAEWETEKQKRLK